jgi:hypothetical protein
MGLAAVVAASGGGGKRKRVHGDSEVSRGGPKRHQNKDLVSTEMPKPYNDGVEGDIDSDLSEPPPGLDLE